MSEAEASSSKEQYEWYITHLDKHILASRRNLLGYPRDSRYRPTNLIQPSRVGPLETEWSVAEKSAFFAALSRHSRYFPDRIARDCGKSEAEVEWYLDLLEDGAEQVQSRLRVKRWKKSHRWSAGTAPAAREVGDEWIAREEELSSMVPRDNGDAADLDMEQLGSLARALPAHPEWYARRLAPSRVGSRHAKISRDNLDLERLQAKPELDVEEKAVLGVILNRKRNRERYRLRKLLKSTSQEEIEAAGGPAAFFERRGSGTGSGSGSGTGSGTGTLDEVLEQHEETSQVVKKECDCVQKRIEQEGWDVFNFAYFKSPISFPLLGFLYEELVAYLRVHILRAILIAEAQSTDITEEHINIPAVPVIPPDVDDDPASARDVNGLTASTADRVSGLGPGSGVEETPSDALFMQDDASDMESTLTDEEDEKLDRVLNDVDQMYDDMLEEALWAGYETGQTVMDLDDPFARRIKDADALRMSERAAVLHASFDAVRRETLLARSKRRAGKQRSLRFPSTRLRLVGRSLRKNRSAAVVIDSDEEVGMLDDAGEMEYEEEEREGEPEL